MSLSLLPDAYDEVHDTCDLAKPLRSSDLSAPVPPKSLKTTIFSVSVGRTGGTGTPHLPSPEGLKVSRAKVARRSGHGGWSENDQPRRGESPRSPLPPGTEICKHIQKMPARKRDQTQKTNRRKKKKVKASGVGWRSEVLVAYAEEDAIQPHKRPPQKGDAGRAGGWSTRNGATRSEVGRASSSGRLARDPAPDRATWILWHFWLPPCSQLVRSSSVGVSMAYT
ncbi:hypothetical protein Taro_044229, partial [Colocasia esculenta]|nr:hypothetical protein [Colocasia esculenta]